MYMREHLLEKKYDLCASLVPVPNHAFKSLKLRRREEVPIFLMNQNNIAFFIVICIELLFEGENKPVQKAYH